MKTVFLGSGKEAGRMFVGSFGQGFRELPIPIRKPIPADDEPLGLEDPSRSTLEPPSHAIRLPQRDEYAAAA